MATATRCRLLFDGTISKGGLGDTRTFGILVYYWLHLSSSLPSTNRIMIDFRPFSLSLTQSNNNQSFLRFLLDRMRKSFSNGCHRHCYGFPTSAMARTTAGDRKRNTLADSTCGYWCRRWSTTSTGAFVGRVLHIESDGDWLFQSSKILSAIRHWCLPPNWWRL